MHNEHEGPEPPDFQTQQVLCNSITKRKCPKNIRTKLVFGLAALLCLLSCLYRGLYVYLAKQFYEIHQTPRARLEQPRLKIQRRGKAVNEKTSCSFINAGNIVTKTTVNSIGELLKQEQFEVVFVAADLHDVSSRKLLAHSLAGYHLSSTQVEFNADLQWVASIKSQCSKLVYMFGNFKVSGQMSANIAAQSKYLLPLSLYYTSNYLKGESVARSPNLQQADLSQLEPSLFYSYLYIFDTEILNIFAPINFVYFAKYTVEEAILIPALVYYQSANKMHTNYKILHSQSTSFLQFKEFALNSLPKLNNSLCLISYPADPYTISSNQAISYIESIKKQKLDEARVNATIVVYLPYTFGSTQGISEIAFKLMDLAKSDSNLRVKIKIMANKTSPAHAVYESVYSFCPNHAMVISSRHNVRFHQNMFKQILNWVSTRYHYYYFNFQDSSGEKKDLDTSIDYDYEFVDKEGRIFEQKLRHVQVFKSDLMKMVPFWILKSAQVDFYETEAAFVFNMIQTIRKIKIKVIQEVLVTVIDRNMSQTQSTQIKNIKLYSTFTALLFNFLHPYQFNSLENPVLRRNAPNKMPPYLHQIWLSKAEISEVRQALHKTMVQANPNLKMHLWKKQNVTKENLPLTYNLISIILQKNKQSSKSLFVMASDLMRYQLLLQFGGIYVDFKWQGNRPLDNFLKYESFFIDFDIEFIRFGRPKALGNGFMGATPNNYHLKAVLNQMLNQRTLTFGSIIPFITGGWIVRNALSDYEIFTQIGLGYYFFVPYVKVQNFCGGDRIENYGPDSKEYSFMSKGKAMKLRIPCKIYPDSYGVLYNQLAGTWLKANADLN